ncbi:hypothetical protein BJY17_002357 [Agromyces hippuratus]|uniref:Uncharacterized protein n=2 Tax=Agromyces hippuratus TaxID=286438 RepID=A0A852WZG7_9MICO|nr:hypothetical protein [Agromyces hippuratus]NYG21610.1 hypothetical protein [Agromyces hippuratus]
MSHRAEGSGVLRAVGVALVLLLGVAGCVPSPPDPVESPSPEVIPGPRLGDRLDDDGTIPLDLALDLFAAGFGPIDGGDPDAVELPVHSGTMAIRGLMRHWEELTPDQQSTVDAIFESGARDEAETGDAADLEGTDLGGRVVPALRMEPTESIRGITALVAEVQAELEDLLGRRLSVPIEAGASDAVADPKYHAFAWANIGGSHVGAGRMDACEIDVLQPGWDVIDTPQFRTLIAHEVMHCFQFDGAGGVADVADGASWVVEGGATFAAVAVAPTDYFDARWDEWLREPRIPLSKREYDALGVFAVAEQEGADVWQHLVPLLQAGDTAAGLELLFDRPREEALTAIARRLVREPRVGPEWDSDGPHITTAQGAIGIILFTGASIDEVATILPFATAPYTIGFEAGSEVIDVAVFGGRGVIGVPRGATDEVGTEFLRRYCVTGFCECPGGGVLGTELPPGARLGLALTSPHPSAPSTVTIQASTTSQAEACGNRTPGEVLVVRFDSPEPFEVHGGHCIVQDSGDLLIQAGDGRMPQGYDAPTEHRDDVAISIYKNPASAPHAGSVDLSVGGVRHSGGSTILVSPDGLSGSFALDSGYAGEWVCAGFVTPEEAFGTG